MRAELRRSIFLACVGLLAGFALVVTLYGAGTLFKHGLGSPMEPGASDGAVAPLLATPPADPKPATDPKSSSDPKTPPVPKSSPAPKSSDGQGARPGEGAAQPAGKPRAALEGQPSPGRDPTLPPDGEAPSFDIIRIEPDGEAVIAGRAMPNTTVELLRDNAPIARALVDPSGQFALVPPALPVGDSEITLRVTGADGRVRVSRDSVTVVVAANRAAKPLIALTSPDKPTIVLSQPDSATASAPMGTDKAGRANPRSDQLATNMPGGILPGGTLPGDGNRTVSPKSAPGTPPRTGQPKPDPSSPRDATKPAAPGAAGSEKAAPVKIVSVEAEDGGRLYVTSQAQPGATVRLYLNDTLVAPGSAGADGRIAFTIGRGVRPGDYRIRVDQVDPVSGTVKARSEVAFAVPAAAIKPPAKTPQDAASLPSPNLTSASAPPASAPPGSVPVASVPAAGTTPAGVAPASPSSDSAAGLHARPAPSAVARVENPAASQPAATPASRPTGAAQAIAGPTASGTVAMAPARATPETAPAPPPAATGETRTVFVPEIGTARIIRGDSLWQISRRIYGKGTRYTVIYDANQPQIRNPDLIYPGQIFVLPSEGTAAVPQGGTRG